MKIEIPEMSWYVYRYDINFKKIYEYNIFNHYKFYCDALTSLQTSESKEEFAEQLRKDAMYYFWCKAEHEVVITSFPPYIDKKEANRIANENFNYQTHLTLCCGEKIDIFSQLKLNWNVFVDYIWSFRLEG